jgi:hypothetical protein
MTNDDDAFEEFLSLCPPVIAAAATRCRRYHPLHVDQGFLLISPKMLPIGIPVTLRWLWLLETIDDGEGRGDGGGERGGDLCRCRQDSKSHFPLSRNTSLPRRRPNDNDALHPQHQGAIGYSWLDGLLRNPW